MEKLIWKTEKRKLKDLKGFRKNPRQISKEQYANLQKSLDEFNYVELAAIDLDNTILAGHMRLKAYASLYGDKSEIEVRVPNRKLTEEEAEKYVIRSNKNTGEWDWDTLANEFEIELLLDCGFTSDELAVDIEQLLSEDKPEKEKKKKSCPNCGHEF